MPTRPKKRTALWNKSLKTYKFNIDITMGIKVQLLNLNPTSTLISHPNESMKRRVVCIMLSYTSFTPIRPNFSNWSRNGNETASLNPFGMWLQIYSRHFVFRNTRQTVPGSPGPVAIKYSYPRSPVPPHSTLLCYRNVCGTLCPTYLATCLPEYVERNRIPAFFKCT